MHDALTHLEMAQAYGEQYLDDQLVIDAVCMRLSAAIETLAALDQPKLDELFGADWPLMWGMRNRIAHGYLLVDADIIRETLRSDVPKIAERIRSAI